MPDLLFKFNPIGHLKQPIILFLHMSGLKRLFIFYIHANFHVALSAWCLTKVTQIEFGSIGEGVGLFVFASTITSYNLLRYWKRKEIPASDADWLLSHKRSLLLLNALASFAILFFGAALQKESLFLLIPLFLATLFYNMPFQFGSQSLRLRNISGLKILLVCSRMVFCYGTAAIDRNEIRNAGGPMDYLCTKIFVHFRDCHPIRNKGYEFR